MKTGLFGTQSLFCSDQYIKPFLSIAPFHDWTMFTASLSWWLLAKKGYFIMHQKYLKSCKHPFLKGASLDLWYMILFCCFDPFLKEKVFFLISVAHICSILSLSYCRYSQTDSSLKQEYQNLCITSTRIHLWNDLYSFFGNLPLLSCINQFQHL